MAKKLRAWDFEHPRKEFLQELLSVAHSLEGAADAVAFLKSRAQRGKIRKAKDESEFLIEISVYWYAVMSYMRCFTTGRHSRLDINAISKVTKAQREFHQSLREVRNKYIAHPTGHPFEGAMILLHATTESEHPNRFVSFHAKLSGETGRNLGIFARLLDCVLNHVHAQIEKVGDEIAVQYLGQDATWKSAGGWKPRRTN